MAKSILGALLFDRKPIIPELPEVDLQGAQTEAIAGNLQSLPSLMRLGRGVNTYLTDEIARAAEKILPGYGKLMASGTDAIQRGVEGDLPAGVEQALKRYGAEYGIGSGTGPESEFGRFGTVSLLGKESLKYSMNMLNTAERWLSQARSATPLFNFQSMFVTPAQQLATDQYNQQTQWQHQWMKNQLEAAPEGWEAAVQGFLDWAATTGLNIAGAYAGGGMGTGGQPGQSPGGGSNNWQSYMTSGNPAGGGDGSTGGGMDLSGFM